MQQLPEPLAPLGQHSQFICYRLVPSKTTPGKLDKIPVSPHTAKPYIKGEDWQKDPSQWASAPQACAVAQAMGPDYGVGFLFTERDPFWFLDIDDCLVDGARWSDAANNIMACLPGCAVEVSQSGKGLHLFGSGAAPRHACKNKEFNCEFYHTGRFVALTGSNAVGNASLDFTQLLPPVINYYFPPKEAQRGLEWTTEPVEGYTCEDSDEELITRALTSGGANRLFGVGVTFKDLWECNEAALGAKWPSDKDDPYDGSSADMALAQHLMFWTGGDCERTLELMHESQLSRPKWERESYLRGTIEQAHALQETFYSVHAAVVTPEGAVALKGSAEQVKWAEVCRAEKLAGCTKEEFETLSQVDDASLWMDAKELTAAQMVAALAPATTTTPVFNAAPVPIDGDRYLPIDLQKQLFSDCSYVTSEKGIYTPSAGILSQDQFNAVYGGYTFEMGLKKKDTGKAWDAFLNNSLIQWPRVHRTCFRPREAPHAIIKDAGQYLINTYQPIEVPSKPGDVTPFTDHLAKLVLDQNDRDILLYYMAACVQHKGCKFQWAPFIQGVEGNGKTLLSLAVIEAIGHKYAFMPLASNLGEKYNDWAFGRLFIGIEDIYVPEAKQEVIEIIKPMITNSTLSKRGMRESEDMQDLFSNWMLNSNYKEGYRKSRNDRRIAPFFTAQQHEDDLARDGMNGEYFAKIYDWCRAGGWAHITHYLQNIEIPAEFNPALEMGGRSHRAPKTTSTEQAIVASRGGVEQEILEQIEQGVRGFRGGWISSVALHQLLVDMRKENCIPRTRRRTVLQQLGYDYHPTLKEGKASRALDVDCGKRPKIFCHKDHPSISMQSPGEVTDAYERAQQKEPSKASAAVVDLFNISR